MSVSQAQLRATAKYSKKNYNTMTIRIRKDADMTLDMIKQAADDAGESLNQYILMAVRQRMEK